MTKDELNTREKILHIAHGLFAEKGFNGVSVREIAKEADVNIAAINYHFGNKETLYGETIRSSSSKVGEDIREIYEKLGVDSNTEKLAEGIYDYFLAHKEDLLTGFKLFLTSQDATMDYECHHQGDEIGPPGGRVIYDCLKNEVPHAKEMDLLWAVRTIFTQILHRAMLMSTRCEFLAKKYGVGPEAFKEDTLRLVRIVVKEIKQP